MRLIIFFVSIMTTCYAFSSYAAHTDWNNDTAYMLATASKCAYKVTRGDPMASKRGVIKCLTKAAKDAEAEKLIALKVFSELENDLEIFTLSKSSSELH